MVNKWLAKAFNQVQAGQGAHFTDRGTFVVHSVDDFAAAWGDWRSWKTFHRSLNKYNFRKVEREKGLLEFCHPEFQKDRPDLLAKIRRTNGPKLSSAGSGQDEADVAPRSRGRSASSRQPQSPAAAEFETPPRARQPRTPREQGAENAQFGPNTTGRPPVTVDGSYEGATPMDTERAQWAGRPLYRVGSATPDASYIPPSPGAGGVPAFVEPQDAGQQESRKRRREEDPEQEQEQKRRTSSVMGGMSPGGMPTVSNLPSPNRGGSWSRPPIRLPSDPLDLKMRLESPRVNSALMVTGLASIVIPPQSPRFDAASATPTRAEATAAPARFEAPTTPTASATT